MNQSDIQTAVQQAILGFFSAAVPNPGNVGSFQRDVDKDPFKTGFPRFCSLDQNADIFTFLKRFQTTVANLLGSDDEKKKVLMDRISLMDRQRLSTVNLPDFDYGELKKEVGRLLSTSNQGKQFEKFFSDMKVSSTSKVYAHFLKASEKWDGYVAWRAAVNKTPPEESMFLDKFEESVPAEIKKKIIQRRIDAQIIDIQTLGTYITTYKSVWDVEGEVVNTQALVSQLNTLQQQNESLKQALDLVAKEQQKATSIAEASKNLTQVHSDSHAKLAEQVSRQALNLQTQLNHLEQSSKSLQDTINEQKFNTQRNYLEIQNQARINTFSLNNMSTPYVHRDRHENFNPHRGRDRQSYSPGRGRSPDSRNGYSSGDSRSPSPNPIDNKCFGCSEKHWMVECPYLSRIEKENEIYKLLEKKRKSNKARPDEEQMLRNEYGVPKNPQCPIQLVTQLNNTPDRRQPPQGRGPYCKWCHLRGHSTLVCAAFCPLCEKLGHSWRECSDPAQKDLKEKRKVAFQANLAKADRLSYRA